MIIFAKLNVRIVFLTTVSDGSVIIYLHKSYRCMEAEERHT